MEGSGELLSDPLAPFPQPQDGGSWAADGGIWTDYLLDLRNRSIHGDDHHGGAEDLFDLFTLLDDDDSLGTKQLAADSSWVNHVQADAGPSQIPVGADQPPPPPVVPADANIIQAGFDSADMLTTTEPDNEMEVAEMVRVAAQCGERTLWSEEEQKELLASLDLYAEVDAVTRCFKIAFHLPNKTALDVALRCRWLKDKSKTAERTELAQKDGAPEKPNKVKGTKMAKISNKIYPLSKEALKSKSNKELIEDNNMFLKRIEENLKTGQLANTADYFYYVKTNMDAIEERGSEFGVSMAMPPIDEQGLEEILRSRLSSLALTEDA